MGTSAQPCSGVLCLALLLCWLLDTAVSLDPSTLPWASPSVWLDGSSSCSRCSWVKQAASLPVVTKSTSTSKLHSASCVSSLPLGGLSTHSATCSVLMGAVDDSVLNLVYNLADFVNKIAFCLAIWASAKNSTLAAKEGSLLADHA